MIRCSRASTSCRPPTGAAQRRRTSAGFDVLARLAVATDAGLVKATATTALGSKFANDVLLCMSVAGYVNPVDFSLALGAGGAFAVRDGGALNQAVTSRTSDLNGPLFGAEPQGSTWPLAGKTLFYGWPLGLATLAGDDASGSNFELRSLPSGLTFTPPIRAGVCVTDALSARILHLHDLTAVILPPAGRPNFCPAPPSASLDPAGSPFAFAARTLASWLAPQPAYAARAMMPPSYGGGGGGLVSGLSEIGPVEFTGSLAFQGNVPNAARSDTAKALDGNPLTSQFIPIIRVRAVSAAGQNPLAGVTITFSVVGNKGSFAAHNLSAVTDAAGYAAFPDFWIDKSGGYTITASSTELPGASATSNLFNITGQ